MKLLRIDQVNLAVLSAWHEDMERFLRAKGLTDEGIAAWKKNNSEPANYIQHQQAEGDAQTREEEEQEDRGTAPPKKSWRERLREEVAAKETHKSVIDTAAPDDKGAKKERDPKEVILSDGRVIPCKPDRTWYAAEISRLFFHPLRDHFCSFRQPDGSVTVYEINERREAIPVSNLARLETVMAASLEGYQVHPETTSKARKMWLREQPRALPEAPGLISLDPPTPGCPLVMRRPDVKVAQGPTPAWDQFLDRLNYADGFLAWVWTLFEPRAASRQYLWIQGLGMDGKSQVAEALVDFIGSHLVGILGEKDFKDGGDRFAAKKLLGKALGLYGEAKNRYAPQTELVRKITGRDTHDLEGKGVDSTTGRLSARLFVHSNVEPVLDDTRAATSRCLLIRVLRLEENRDVFWRERLVGEMGQVLFRCREAYRKLCSGHGDIPISAEVQADVERLASDSIERFAEVLARFKIEDGGIVAAASVAEVMAEIFGKNHDDRRTQEFKAFAASKGVRTMHGNPSRRLYYVGMSRGGERLRGVRLDADGKLRDG
jgi:hypothetical protein